MTLVISTTSSLLVASYFPIVTPSISSKRRFLCVSDYDLAVEHRFSYIFLIVFSVFSYFTLVSFLDKFGI